MSKDEIHIVVAGHICLDITPAFPAGAADQSLERLLRDKAELALKRRGGNKAVTASAAMIAV